MNTDKTVSRSKSGGKVSDVSDMVTNNDASVLVIQAPPKEGAVITGIELGEKERPVEVQILPKDPAPSGVSEDEKERPVEIEIEKGDGIPVNAPTQVQSITSSVNSVVAAFLKDPVLKSDTRAVFPPNAPAQVQSVGTKSINSAVVVPPNVLGLMGDPSTRFQEVLSFAACALQSEEEVYIPDIIHVILKEFHSSRVVSLQECCSDMTAMLFFFANLYSFGGHGSDPDINLPVDIRSSILEMRYTSIFKECLRFQNNGILAARDKSGHSLVEVLCRRPCPLNTDAFEECLRSGNTDLFKNGKLLRFILESGDIGKFKALLHKDKVLVTSLLSKDLDYTFELLLPNRVLDEVLFPERYYRSASKAELMYFILTSTHVFPLEFISKTKLPSYRMAKEGVFPLAHLLVVFMKIPKLAYAIAKLCPMLVRSNWEPRNQAPLQLFLQGFYGELNLNGNVPSDVMKLFTLLLSESCKNQNDLVPSFDAHVDSGYETPYAVVTDSPCAKKVYGVCKPMASSIQVCSPSPMLQTTSASFASAFSTSESPSMDLFRRTEFNGFREAYTPGSTTDKEGTSPLRERTVSYLLGYRTSMLGQSLGHCAVRSNASFGLAIFKAELDLAFCVDNLGAYPLEHMIQGYHDLGVAHLLSTRDSVPNILFTFLVDLVVRVDHCDVLERAIKYIDKVKDTVSNEASSVFKYMFDVITTRVDSLRLLAKRGVNDMYDDDIYNEESVTSKKFKSV